MIPKDLFQNIKRIEITTKRLVTDVFAGQYHSVFKGQGIEFDEVREYQFGDDVRSIDWNVTARTGKPYIKKFVEERELTVMILVDVSESTRFGSVKHLKSHLAAEVSALLALSASRNNDKIGLIIFTDKIEKFIPPRKGLSHVLRVVREILYFEPEHQKTDLIQAIDYLNKVTTRGAITFLISDFLVDQVDPENADLRETLKKSLSAANKKHDLTAICLNDPKETTLTQAGLVELEDAETGKSFIIDTTSPRLREHYNYHNDRRVKSRDQLFRSVGVDSINLSTDSSYSDEMIKFFLRRQKSKFR